MRFRLLSRSPLPLLLACREWCARERCASSVQAFGVTETTASRSCGGKRNGTTITPPNKVVIFSGLVVPTAIEAETARAFVSKQQDQVEYLSVSQRYLRGILPLSSSVRARIYGVNKSSHQCVKYHFRVSDLAHSWGGCLTTIKTPNKISSRLVHRASPTRWVLKEPGIRAQAIEPRLCALQVNLKGKGPG